MNVFGRNSLRVLRPTLGFRGPGAARMTRRECVTVLAGTAAGWPLGACEQQRARSMPIIAFLAPGPQTYQEEFTRGMSELGHVSGKASIVFRFAEEHDGLLPSAAQELAQQPVDVIVASNSAATAAALAVTKTIPIVMVTSGDPVATGFIRSLARPGGNVTGLSSLVPEMSVKQLELLKAVSPKISRIAVFWNPNNLSNTVALPQLQVASNALDVELVPIEVRTPVDLQAAFNKVRQASPNALLALIDQVTTRQRNEVVNFAASISCPAMYALKNFVDVGGLMSYGVSFNYLHYRAAYYVDKILKGSSPADLPVEQPTRIEFFINVKTAQALGLTIPMVVRARAEVI